MQPSVPDELDRASGLHEHSPAPELPTQQIALSGRYCGGCGASMEPDQRYCVECGQRRGPAHPALAGHLVQRVPAAPVAAPRRRGPRLNVNAALIAGVGTLMLAMGTGVLIGRTATGAGGSGSGTVQVLTVPSSAGAAPGASAAGGAAAGQTGQSSGEAAAGSKSTAGSTSKAKHSGKPAKSSGAASSASEEGSGPEKAVVKIGEAGKGPGYKKGHFTGEFFGGQ